MTANSDRLKYFVDSAAVFNIMTKHLIFFCLTYFFHQVKVQAFLEPKLYASSFRIKETDWVTLSCEAPSSQSAFQCYLYTFSGKTATTVPCDHKLTGSELLEMANVLSPAQVEMTCCYIVVRGGDCSLKSNKLFIMIETPPPPELTVNPSVITEKDSVTLSCQPPPSVSLSVCGFYFQRKGTIIDFPCKRTLTAAELLHMAGLTSPAQVKVNCCYNVKYVSPYSDISTITIISPPPTPSNVSPTDTHQTGPTSTPSNVSPTDTHQTVSLWMRVLLVVVAGCGLIVGVIFLGGVILKKYQNKVSELSSASAAASSPDCVEPVALNAHHSDSDSTHLYFTIPDKPAACALRDMTYSTVGPH